MKDFIKATRLFYSLYQSVFIKLCKALTIALIRTHIIVAGRIELTVFFTQYKNLYRGSLIINNEYIKSRGTFKFSTTFETNKGEESIKIFRSSIGF